MHMSEQHAVACLNAQDSSKAIDIADHIEEIWNIFSLRLNSLDLNNLAVNLSRPNTSPASVGVYAYCCLYRQWEKQALVELWNVLIKQKPELPQLNTVQAIEDWFENQENSTILDTIQSLDLNYRNLLALPPQILKFSKLQSLSLHCNQLTTLPDRIGELAQLQELYLHSNQLTTLPDRIGELTQLGMLHLDNNRLTTIPDQIGELAQLQRLFLSNNQLTTLPDRIGELTQLNGSPSTTTSSPPYRTGSESLHNCNALPRQQPAHHHTGPDRRACTIESALPRQ